MTGTARVGDKTFGDCEVHGKNISGTIISGSPNTLANNMLVARVGDKVLADCGHTATIITGSPNTLANNMLVARLGDLVGNSPYTARIITSSPDTNTN